MKKKISVLTIGGATQDVFLHYENPDIIENNKKKLFLLLEAGSKIDIKSLGYHTGGGATNSAVAFKKLGFEVSCFCKLGEDYRGNFIIEDLQKKDISSDNIIYSKKHETAVSFVVPTAGGDRVILAFRGANADLQENEIPYDKIAQSDQLYITSLKSSELLLPITEFAKNLKIPIAVNPGMNQLKSDINIFMKSLNNIDILILNASEAKALMLSALQSDLLGDNFLQKKSSNNMDSPELMRNFMTYEEKNISISTYFKFILQNGPKCAVITNGSEGVYAAENNKIYFHKSLPVKVVNSLGAGDAFGSTFTAAKLFGKSVETAIIYGIINASSVIGHEGAKIGLLTLEEIEEKIKEITLNIRKFDIT